MAHGVQFIETDNQIKETVLQLISQQSFEIITVNAIIKATHIGRSTFYEHYEDKYAVVEAMNRQYTSLFAKLIDERIPRLKDSHQAADNLYEVVKVLMQHQSKLYRLLDLKISGISLTDDFSEVLSVRLRQSEALQQYSEQFKVDVNYLTNLYTVIAMTQIKWQLEHGEDEAVIALSNRLLSVARIGLGD